MKKLWKYIKQKLTFDYIEEESYRDSGVLMEYMIPGEHVDKRL